MLMRACQYKEKSTRYSISIFWKLLLNNSKMARFVQGFCGFSKKWAYVFIK